MGDYAERDPWTGRMEGRNLTPNQLDHLAERQDAEKAVREGYTNRPCQSCGIYRVRALHTPQSITLTCQVCGHRWDEKT